MRLAFVPLLGLAALAAVVVLAGGRPAPSAFERVVAHPERFRAQQVAVTGRVRDIEAPTGYPSAFVLEGPQGRRLLIVPRLAHRVAARTPGGRATVRGEVIPLEPRADGHNGRDEVVTLGELARRVQAGAILQTGT